MNASDNSIAGRLMARYKHRYFSKATYLAALKESLAGVSLDLGANAVSDIEARFAEGLAAGKSEAEIAAGLADPRQVAAKLKAASSSAAFAQRKSVPNLWRMFIALIGLAFFNLFMVVPAIVFAACLTAFYAVSFAVYVGGIAMTAGGVSGVNDVTIDRAYFAHPSSTTHAEPVRVHLTGDSLLVEPADNDGIHLSADIEGMSRGEQTAGGLALVAGGILMLLLSLLITKYTLIGLKRYVVMNYKMLVGA
ncbi:MAG TPA: DUF1700 domain-containing protein [Burkholderiaceae bacterium]